MAGRLRGWLDATSARLAWLELDAYAFSVFAQGREAARDDPARWAGAVADAQRMARSAAVSVDLLAPHLREVEHSPELAARLRDAAPLDALREALALEDVRRRVDETVAALEHRLGGDADLILRLPAPVDALRRLGATQDDVDPDDADDAGALLAERIRGLSTRAVDGIVLETAAPGERRRDELEAADPLLASARHYRWVSALRLERWEPEEGELRHSADLLLLPGAGCDELIDAWWRGAPVGGGLPPAFWSGDEPLDPLPERSLLYGDVPPDVPPERVVERIEAIHRALA